MEDFIPLIIYLAILILVGVLIIAVSHLLSPRAVPTSPEWRRAYECGLLSEGIPQERYPIKYYLVAILFVVFDLETVFLYPWAVSLKVFKESGSSYLWFLEMLVFILILIVGYIYIVSKEVLLWSERE